MVRFESKILPPADADEVYSKLYALINSVGTVKGKTSDEIENETFNLIKKIETNAIAKKLTFAQFLRGMDRALELLQAQVWRIMQSSLNKQKSEHQRPVQQQLQESYSLGMKRKIPEQTEQLQQKQQKVDNHFVSQQSMQQAACTGTMQQLSTQYEQQPQPHHMTYAMHQGIDRQLNGQFTLQPQQLLQHNMKHCSVELPVKPVGQVQNSQLELHSYPVVQPLHQLNAPQPIPPATVQPLGQFQQMQPQQLNFQQSPMLIQQLSVNQQEDMPLHTMQYIPQCNALPPSLQHKREDYQPVMQLQQKLQTNQVHLQHSIGHSMHKQQLPLHMYPMQSTQQYSLQQQRMSSLHQSTQQPQQHLIDQRYAQPFQQQSQVTLIQQYSIPQPLEILLPEQNCPASHPPSQSMAYSITHCDNKPYISLSQTNIFSAHPIEQSGTIYHPQSMPAQQQQQQQHQQQQQQQFMQQQTQPITFASNYSNSTSQTHTTPPTSTADSADSMMSARQESRLLEWFITSKPKLPRLLDRVRQSSNLFSNDTIREGVAACERLMGLPVPTHEHHDDIRKLYLALRAYNSMLAHYKKQQQQHVASNNGVMENKSQVMGSDHHMHINSSMNHQSDITINNSSTPHHVHQTEVASVGPTVQHVQQYHIAVPQDNPPLASASSAKNQNVETVDYPVEAYNTLLTDDEQRQGNQSPEKLMENKLTNFLTIGANHTCNDRSEGACAPSSVQNCVDDQTDIVADSSMSVPAAAYIENCSGANLTSKNVGDGDDIQRLNSNTDRLNAASISGYSSTEEGACAPSSVQNYADDQTDIVADSSMSVPAAAYIENCIDLTMSDDDGDDIQRLNSNTNRLNAASISGYSSTEEGTYASSSVRNYADDQTDIVAYSSMSVPAAAYIENCIDLTMSDDDGDDIQRLNSNTDRLNAASISGYSSTEEGTYASSSVRNYADEQTDIVADSSMSVPAAAYVEDCINLTMSDDDN